MSEQNTQEANKALMRRWFEEVWNQGRADLFPRCLPKMESRMPYQMMLTRH